MNAPAQRHAVTTLHPGTPSSSPAQDKALSRLERGFESRWGRYLTTDVHGPFFGDPVGSATRLPRAGLRFSRRWLVGWQNCPLGSRAALLYSGQSETGYELFSLVPEFSHVGGMAYVAGESDLSPIAFSPDGRLAALAVEKSPFWWTDPNDDDADWETPSAGGLFDWSTLDVHTLGERAPVEFALRVNAPRGWYPGGSGAWPERLRFVGRSTLVVGVPWAADFTFDLPSAGGSIVVPSPKGRG